MKKRTLGYILFLVGVGICLFFHHLHGFPYWLAWMGGIVGVVVMICGIYLRVKGDGFKNSQASKELNKLRGDIKLNGEKIIVDLSTCEIKGNDYTVQEDRVVEGWAPVSAIALFDSEHNIVNRAIDQAQFVFRHERNSHLEKFISPVIPRGADDLKIKLYLQKTTTLYVDKNDRSKYYFDLDFLKQQE